MCGIVGIIAQPDRSVDVTAIVRMARAVAHRGPDALGFIGYRPSGTARASQNAECAAGTQVAFGHRRLAIIDLSEAGRQPMSTADGRYWVVFNGEIYNYVELRRELEKAGATFRTNSDTEVLLVGFSVWGKNVFAKLSGMFALAILDTYENTVLLARDPFGIKPLYYAHINGQFAFASELKALLAQFPRRLANARAIFDYLRFDITDHSQETLLRGVLHAPPGHWLEIDLTKTIGLPTPVPYSNGNGGARQDISFAEAAARTRELFLAAIEQHLRSDVPVGACLSGGIDSSACVAAMRYVQGRSLDLHTFTYVADDAFLNEERWANIAASHVGAIVHRVTITATELRRDIDELLRTQDEPFGSTSVYAQNRLFQCVAKSGIKVVLDGQGGDELLAGYSSYFGVRFASLIRRGDLDGAIRLWLSLNKRGGSGLHAFVRAGQSLLPEMIQAPLRRLAGRQLFPRWINRKWLESESVQPVSLRYGLNGSPLRTHLAFDVTHGLRTLLRYEDRNSMRYGVESRVPFLDTDFARFVQSLPEEYLISRDGTTKSVFRAAMRGIVSDAILDRRDKVGFEPPETHWLLQLRPWVEETLESDAARSMPIFDHQQLLATWRSIVAQPRRYRAWSWRCVNLIKWAQHNDVQFA